MEKKLESGGIGLKIPCHKAILAMKLTCFLMCCLLFNVQAAVKAQGQTVSLKLEQVSVAEAIRQLKEQTQLDFFFSNKQVDVDRKVSLDLQDIRLDEALKMLLGEGYAYEFLDDVVIIKPVEAKNPEMGVPQEKVTVKGVVRDEKGHPLPGVAILLKGTTIGVATDIDGKYSLQLPSSQSITLVFSFVGMKTQEIAYTGQSELNVVMVAEASELEDVVVTGYQTIVREKVTGSTSTVTSRQLEERYTPNILDNLEGRVAGLVTYGDKTLIRGSSSMYAETEPLLVVDGLPIEGSIEDLNPYDIESITVLKDAAAAAIYGARASNGVIVVTTKMATKEGKTEIQFSGNLTIYEKKNMDYHDNFYMTPAEQVDKESEYWEYYFSSENTSVSDPIASFQSSLDSFYPISLVAYAYYQRAAGELTDTELEDYKNELKQNNFAEEYGKHALRRQFLQQYNLALRTRTEKFNSSLVFNFKRDNNGIVNSYGNQLNVSYRVSYDVKKWLTANFSFNGILSKAKESASQYATEPFNQPSYYRLLNDDGSYNYYSTGMFNQFYTLDDEDPGLKSMDFNHLEELYKDSRITDRRNMRYQGELLFKIIDGLTVNTSFVYETERQNVSNYSEADSYVMRMLRNIYTLRQGTEPNYT